MENKNKNDQGFAPSEALSNMGSNLPVPEEEKKLLAELSTIDVIYQCGKVQLPFEQIALILNQRLSKTERIALVAQLNDKNSPEFQAYARGVAEGDATLKISLHDSASTGDSDAYKNLTAEQRKNAINQSIRKNFGIGEPDDD